MSADRIAKLGGMFLALVVTLAAQCLVAAPRAAARTVVLQASGPSATKYPAGQLLSEPLRLQLLAGDRLTILDEFGTRTLSGPATITQPSSGPVEAKSHLTWESVTADQRRPRAAGVRDSSNLPPPMPAATPQTELWRIDALSDGDWCYSTTAPFGFWRPDKNAAGTLALSTDGSRASVAWVPGTAALDWPERVPLQDGRTYSASLDASRARTFVVHQISGAATFAGLASDLADRKCYHQLAMLLGP